MGEEDAAIVPYSVLDMLYASPEIEEMLLTERTRKEFGKEWKALTVHGLEEEIVNTEHSFNFSLFALSQPQEEHVRLYEEYAIHLRQRKKELNHNTGPTHKLMNHLYQYICYLYYNNQLNLTNTHIAWELTGHINVLEESYKTNNLLDSIIAMHETKADTLKMVGSVEGRMDILEWGLKEIKEAQELRELHPSIRNVKGAIFQYMAALSNTKYQIKENINKSLYQFEEALNKEFNANYVQNYSTSITLVENFDLEKKEEYFLRERNFFESIQKKYPDVGIRFIGEEDDDEEYEY